jgi:hypothetical protein
MTLTAISPRFAIKILENMVLHQRKRKIPAQREFSVNKRLSRYSVKRRLSLLENAARFNSVAGFYLHAKPDLVNSRKQRGFPLSSSKNIPVALWRLSRTK